MTRWTGNHIMNLNKINSVNNEDKFSYSMNERGAAVWQQIIGTDAMQLMVMMNECSKLIYAVVCRPSVILEDKWQNYG